MTSLSIRARVVMDTYMTLETTSVEVNPQQKCSPTVFVFFLLFISDIDEAEAGSCDCEDVCINKFLDRDGVKFVCECSDVNTFLSDDGRTCLGIVTRLH